MIDHGDADFAFLASMGVGGWLGAALLAAAISFAFIASDNAEECAKQKCAHGAAKLIDHECLCVETPGMGRW